MWTYVAVVFAVAVASMACFATGTEASTPVASPTASVVPVPADPAQQRSLGFGFSLLYSYTVRSTDGIGERLLGEIWNDSDTGQPVPALSIQFVSDDGLVLLTWPVRPLIAWAGPDERIPVMASWFPNAPDAPKGWAHVTIVASASPWEAEEVSTDELAIRGLPIEGSRHPDRVLQGEIVNTGAKPRSGPVYVRIAHYDNEGHLLAMCNGDSVEADLATGGSGHFSIIGRCSAVDFALAYAESNPTDAFYRLYLVVVPQSA